MSVMMMPSKSAFSQLPIQKCKTLVKKPRVSAGCMHTQHYSFLHGLRQPCDRAQSLILSEAEGCTRSTAMYCTRCSSKLKPISHTGSARLGVLSLKALGEGTSSSENKLGALFLASNIIGISSSCSSGSFSAKLVLVKLEACLCMLKSLLQRGSHG